MLPHGEQASDGRSPMVEASMVLCVYGPRHSCRTSPQASEG